MKRFFSILGFLAFYIGDVIKSNFRIAHDVLTPKNYMKPGIIAVDVTGMTERQLIFMANLITMTPGTLCLWVSEDHNTLYIHCMYVDGSPEEAARALEDSYGRRVRNVF